MQYMYVSEEGLGDKPQQIEFEGDLNQISARRTAERMYGPGGRLFREVESSEDRKFGSPMKRFRGYGESWEDRFGE